MVTRFNTPIAIMTNRMIRVEYAAAMLTPPCSHSLRIEAVTILHLALTRKMIAERLVMCRVKLKINPARRAGRMSGSVTLRNVYCASPPRMLEASSIEGSIC